MQAKYNLHTLHQKVLAHWRENLSLARQDLGFSMSHRDCAFCQQFFYFDCHNCPIKEKTGQTHCEGTPYERIKELICARRRDTPFDDFTYTPKLVGAVEAELRFLESLPIPKPAEPKISYYKDYTITTAPLPAKHQRHPLAEEQSLPWVFYHYSGYPFGYATSPEDARKQIDQKLS